MMGVNTNRMERNAVLARRIAAESMVLLKNEKECLPLQEGSRLALFGVGQVRTVKGGTGSGEVNNLKSTSILEGLSDKSAFAVDPELAALYTEHAKTTQISKVSLLKYDSNHYEELVPEEALIKAVAERNEAAVVVISRMAGEGSDVDASELFLSEKEAKLLDLVCANFQQTILVLNTPGMMEISPWIEKVTAILFIGLPGQEGGSALADVLSGKVCAGGKLTDTWPVHAEDYPNAAYYGVYQPNGIVVKTRKATLTQTDVPYHDDIYVGYRYFDTFGVPVMFPFGYGMSFGQAVIENESFILRKETVEVRADVRSVAERRPCREVLQVYVSSPDGKLEKPYQELKGFAKTKVLSPEEKETLCVRFSVRDLASYLREEAAFVLEAGYYYIRVGFSSRDTRIIGAIRVDETIKTAQLKNMYDPLPDGFEILSKKAHKAISYPVEEAQKRAAEKTAEVLSKEDITLFTADYSAKEKPGKAVNGLRLEAVMAGRGSFEDLAATMSDEDLCRFVCGQGMDFSSFEGFDMNAALNDPSSDAFALIQTQGGGDAVFMVEGEAGQTRDYKDKYGIPPIVLADGPAGLRLTKNVKKNGEVIGHQYCTAFPTGSLIACSFDPALLVSFGKGVGEEMKEYGIDLWLAPGMNLHRNPKCGRNYEYFSEDPVISGLCAGAITSGVQSVWGATTIKHFAANSQEFMRGQSNDIISERALREVYLKGFEIAVKTSHPKALMTAYNDINGVPCADSRELCTYILRDEWGFDGLVMTDWGGGISHPALSMWAGNDMIQPGGALSVGMLKEALELGREGKALVSKGKAQKEVMITREMLEACAVRIMKVAAGFLRDRS